MFQPKWTIQAIFQAESTWGLWGFHQFFALHFLMKHCHFLQENHNSNGNNNKHLIFQPAVFCIQL